MSTEAENNAFDREVQDKLSQLRPSYRPDSWERMASHLDAEEELTDFDEQIVKGLEGLTVPYQPSSWDTLAARMDAELIDDDTFDDALTQRLKQVLPIYQPSSWEILAARLELERQRVRTVVHYKTMELTLLLLLFFTAWQHLPIDTQKKPNGSDREQYPVARLTPKTVLPTNQENASTTITLASDNRSVAKVVQPLPLAHTTLPTDITNGLPAKSSMIDVDRADAPSVDQVVPLPSQSPALLPSHHSPQERLAALRAEKVAAMNSPADHVIAEGAMAALNAGMPALLDYGKPEELLHYIRPSERKTFVRVGFFGSPDFNRVVTPPQPIEDGSIYSSNRYTLGYSGGITIGIEHNERWEVETGLIYAARRYQAIPTVFVTGSVREGFSGFSLQDFELNTFSAPLNFRYNFLVHNKWRIYTQLGAALNLVVQANYYAVDEGAFTSLRGSAGADTEQGVNAVSRPDILKRKSFNDGWLHGGNFWENATLYGDLGVGIERYMTANWGVFVQPNYQHALPFFNDGLGPYEDKIHNFSLRIGLKVRL